MSTTLKLPPPDLHEIDLKIAELPVESLFRISRYESGEPYFGKSVVIPPRRTARKPQRTYDRDLYKARHLIENFFARLKQYRSIATRYDKTARNFLGAIHLAAAVIWLI